MNLRDYFPNLTHNIESAWREGGKEKVRTVLMEEFSYRKMTILPDLELILVCLKVGEFLGQSQAPDQFIEKMGALDLRNEFPLIN